MKQNESFVKVCTEMFPCAGRYGTEKQEIFLQKEHKPRKIFVSILFDEVLCSCSNLLCWRFIKKMSHQKRNGTVFIFDLLNTGKHTTISNMRKKKNFSETTLRATFHSKNILYITETNIVC